MAPLHRRVALWGALLTALGVSPVLHAQAVLLRLNPRVGDTLRTRLDQETEVSGTVEGAGHAPMKTVTTSISVRSRTIVRQSLATGTVVLTVVDSARIRTSDAHAATQVAEAERVLRGHQLLLHLATDGTVESAQDGNGGVISTELAQSMTSMPPVFPQKPVSVGEQWMREMPLPGGGPMGARGSGHVIAAFRLDSLGRGGTIAYVSMQGDIRPDAGGQAAGLSGAVTGSMQIDRARGWMTDSRFSIVLRSLITPPAASGYAPMRLVTRVTQRLRTMDRR